MKRHLSIRHCYLSIALAALAAATAAAEDNVWTGAIRLDYNVGGNWLLFGEGFVPDAGEGGNPFDEIAVINNGDAVYLDTDTGSLDPSGLRIESGSSLTVRNGGVLDIDPTEGTPGLFPGNIDLSSTSGLTIHSGGTLTALGTANLNGTTRMVGPAASFTAGAFNLGSSHTLVAEINDSASHSPLTSATGGVQVGGTLQLAFNGVSPAVGDTWTLVDAAAVSGSFASVVAPPLPRGQSAVVSTVAGGNGEQLQLSIANQLVLTINAVTGAASIENFSTTSAETIDGYSITAAANQFDPSGWNSFAQAGQAGWEEANAAPNHLSELNLTGSRSIGSGQSVDLGTVYQPTTQFGVMPQPVSFTYHVAGGETRQGEVVVSANTLVLQVDPTTGQAQIVNPSGFDVQLDGYSIKSASGALNTAGWTSLEAGAQSGWEEANAAENHISELNLFGSLGLPGQEAGGPISLGNLLAGETLDLEFEFHLVGGSLAGDYNADGTVDAADYTVWRNNLGAPAGTLPNDTAGGPIGAGQYLAWKANFGASPMGGTFTGLVEYTTLAGLSLSTQQVPEPTSLGILALAATTLGAARRWLRAASE